MTTSVTSFSVLPHVAALDAGVETHYIDGGWAEPRTERRWQHRHPATGEQDFLLPDAGPQDVDAAVRAARRAFDEGPWPHLAARERKRLLRPMADLVLSHAEGLHRRQSLDNGVPISLGRSFRFSASIAAEMFDYFTGWVDKLDGTAPPLFAAEADEQFFTVKEPVGVVAAITPFNAPVMQFAHKLAPALAAGCTIVIKPSEYASNVAALYGRLLQELDLPPGVVNIVFGTGRAGAHLVASPGVDKIAFTGRRSVGEAVLASAAVGLRHVSLELGGKSPGIVFPDVPDAHAAGRRAMSFVSMGLTGQSCSTQTRALVHRDVYDEFVAGAASQVAEVRYGDPFDEATTSSPLVNAAAAQHVIDHIGRAGAEGARLVTGGQRWPDAPEGNWVEPTLFADVTGDATIAREELFGPVLCAIPFDTEDEAVAVANASEYGLSAGVFTSDPARALRVARRLRTGTVAVNGLFMTMPANPFGGYKASGLGREGGREGIEEYLETKTISLPLR